MHPAVGRALAHVSALADGPPLDRSLRVTVHFHPDRLAGDVPLLRHLAGDGTYRSQFETGAQRRADRRSPPAACWTRG